jgi:hypothetical protein
MKKRERWNEDAAQVLERISGKNCQGAKQFRADNKRIEKLRRAGHNAHAKAKNQ